MEVIQNYSLRSLNTFGLEAKAYMYAEIKSIEELRELLNASAYKSARKMILGGGSNILFADDFDGLLIRNCIQHVRKIAEDNQSVLIEVGAGMNWHEFVLHTIKEGYPGLENLSLIPGCVGAAPIQNIGAYGVEMKSTFHQLSAVDLATAETKIFNKEECHFGYRDSIFKQEAKNKYAIVSVTFRFDKIAGLNTTYGAIEEQLKKMNVITATIKDVSDAVIAIRRSKLPDPLVIGNAGSFFKNPEIENLTFIKLQENFPQIIGHPSATGKTKLAAGWMIEKCGWKGKRIGNVGMHEKQALVLVNYGNATGQELITHAERVRDSVAERFGVVLEMEVNVVSK